MSLTLLFPSTSTSTLLGSLTDPFNQITLDTSKWVEFLAGSATTTYALSGAQVNYPASTTAATDGDISSITTWSLINSYGYVRVLAVPLAAGITDAEMRFQINSSNYLRWVYESGTLYAQYNVAGVKTTAFSVTYNSSTHLWWQIREGTGNGLGGTPGTVYWDTSSDGINWTNRASVADPITLTALTVLIAGLGTGNDSNPGAFKWNNFNTAPTSAGLAKLLALLGVG